MSSRDFARLQFEWLKQVQDDPEVSATAFALAFAICRHVNIRSLTAWPTQETLANYIRADIRTVRRLTGELSSRDHLAATPQRRRRTPITYRLNLRDRTPMSAHLDTRPDTHVRSQENLTGHFTQSDRTFHALRPDTHVRENTLKEHPYEHSSDQGRDAGASAGGLDEDFKAILFDQGLSYLAEKTNRSPAALRTVIGQMLKLARDDAGHVLSILRQAKRDDRADPVAWTMGVLRNRQGGAATGMAKPSEVIPAGLALSKRAARA